MTRYKMEDDISGEHMAELLERSVERGTRLRRRFIALRIAAVALVICAVAVPLSVVFSQVQGPPTGPTIKVTSGRAFEAVVWQRIDYPGLNFSNVTFPGNIGCNPGSAYGFTVDVQQVSYVESAHGTPIALVLVRCDAGTPAPSSLYAFTTKPGSTEPRILQTLLGPWQPGNQVEWFATRFSISDDAVVLPGHGVTGTAGLCCPNVREDMRWVLRGEHFVRVAEPEHTSQG